MSYEKKLKIIHTEASSLGRAGDSHLRGDEMVWRDKDMK